MRNRMSILMVALTAALVLATAVADARRIEINNTGFRIVWAGANELKIAGEGGCGVTLEGTFHSRTISKVSGQLIGYITRAIAGHPCMNGELWFLNGTEILEGIPVPNTLPWHVRYDSFTGTLPSITAIRIQIVGFAFLYELSGVRCLFESTAAAPMVGDALISAGVITGFGALPERRIRRKAGTILCPSEIEVAGTATITLLGNTTAIKARLVA